MASGLLHILLGSVMHGPVTWGRLLVVAIHVGMTIIGVNAEERQLVRQGGQQYRQFMSQVPTQVIPDYRLLFFTEEEINLKRQSVMLVKEAQ